MKFSLIVCCHNSAVRLPPTLAHLSSLIIPVDCTAEIVVVDNNCSDDTVATVQLLWSNSCIPLRVVEETRAGLFFARLRGVESSAGEVMIFCDDDNWLCPDYIVHAQRVLLNNPRVAIVGGNGVAVTEGDLPDWFTSVQGYFACGTAANYSGDVNCVVGAGMVLRRDAWDELLNRGFKPLLGGRVGRQLSSGDDTEICYALRLLGYRVFQNHHMTFMHYMEPRRLTRLYFRRLVYQGAASVVVLNRYVAVKRGWGMPKLMIREVAEVLKSLRRLLKRYFLSGSSLSHQAERLIETSILFSRVKSLLGGSALTHYREIKKISTGVFSGGAKE